MENMFVADASHEDNSNSKDTYVEVKKNGVKMASI